MSGLRTVPPHPVRRFAIESGVLLVVLLLATIVIGARDLDLGVARHFYTAGGGWTGSDARWPLFLYTYGPWPAIALSLGSLLAIFPRKRRLLMRRRDAVYYVLVMLLGPGLIINLGLKQHVARPRPSALVEFGGQEAHLAVQETQVGPGGASFPCGHSSMGFMLIAPYFRLRRRRRAVARLFLGAGLLAGAAIGFARIVVGAHFLSDVLWAGGLVYATCALLSLVTDWRVRSRQEPAVELVSSAAA